jgi:hypothetical protein
MFRISTLIVVLLLVVLPACQDDKYDNVFNESPTDRRKAYFDNLQSTLIAPEQGWILQYFASPESQGYNLFARFKNASEVVLGANHSFSGNVYAEYASKYDLKIENGPMLSFITYNQALHPFSDPDLRPAISGNFEFRIIDVAEDVIQLSGKRSAVEVRLTRLAANTTGEEYILQSGAMKNFLFAQGTPDLYLEVDDKTFSLSNGYTSVLGIKNVAVDTAAVENIPYIATPTGLRLYKPLEIGGLKMQEFRINDDKSALLATNANAQIVAKKDLSEFFFSSFSMEFPNSWKIDPNSPSGEFAKAYAQIVENCRIMYKEDFKSLFFVYKPLPRGITLSFDRYNGKLGGSLDFEIARKTGSDDEIVFTYKKTGDANGLTYLSNIVGFNLLIQTLEEGSYKIEPESSLSLTSFQLVSVSKPDNKIKLSLN